MNIAIILQPFGLGDCIFAQGIAHHYIRRGYKVYWPVEEAYLDDLKRAYPKINWIRHNMSSLTNVEKAEVLRAQVIPIRWSDTFDGVPYRLVMRAKYDMLGLPWGKWQEDAMWERHWRAEEMLIRFLDLPERFNLVSPYYTGQFKHTREQIVPANNLPNVNITKIGSFSLFDWAGVIERATEIHFVASSNIYMLELLKLQAQRICIYKRVPDQPSHMYYDYILRSHKYELQ
jgi:hypothetical protein